MAPILHYNELSPPVRAVLLTADAIGLELELKTVNLLEKGTHTPEFKKMNPQHTIPTLDDDGFIVWDSHAICAYLVSKYAKNDDLYPKDLQKRAIIDQRLHFDSGILFARLRNFFGPILFFGVKEISTEHQEAIHEAYAFANSFLDDNDYFAGNQLTIADFSAVASLSSVSPIILIEASKYPNLDRWMKKMKTLPYYQEKNGKGADGLSTYINKLLEK